MFKEDLALNNQQWLIYHKTKPNQICFLSNFLAIKHTKKDIAPTPGNNTESL